MILEKLEMVIICEDEFGLVLSQPFNVKSCLYIYIKYIFEIYDL